MKNSEKYILMKNCKKNIKAIIDYIFIIYKNIIFEDGIYT